MSRSLAETVVAIIIENLIIEKTCLNNYQQSSLILEKKTDKAFSHFFWIWSEWIEILDKFILNM